MEIVKLRETDDFIKLGQALKKAGLESSGVDAKADIQEENVKVNGEVEHRRGRKLYDGDIFEFNGVQVKIERG
jgi:ribosome-associated protein